MPPDDKNVRVTIVPSAPSGIAPLMGPVGAMNALYLPANVPPVDKAKLVQAVKEMTDKFEGVANTIVDKVVERARAHNKDKVSPVRDGAYDDVSNVIKKEMVPEVKAMVQDMTSKLPEHPEKMTKAEQDQFGASIKARTEVLKEKYKAKMKAIDGGDAAVDSMMNELKDEEFKKQLAKMAAEPLKESIDKAKNAPDSTKPPPPKPDDTKTPPVKDADKPEQKPVAAAESPAMPIGAIGGAGLGAALAGMVGGDNAIVKFLVQIVGAVAGGFLGSSLIDNRREAPATGQLAPGTTPPVPTDAKEKPASR